MNENTSPKKRTVFGYWRLYKDILVSDSSQHSFLQRSKASKAVKTYHITTDIGIGAQDADISSLYVEVSLDNILNPKLSLINSLKYECVNIR